VIKNGGSGGLYHLIKEEQRAYNRKGKRENGEKTGFFKEKALKEAKYCKRTI